MTIRESRFARLTGHFFAGFLDNDLLTSPQAGMQNLLAQLIGLVAAPGLFWCLLITMKYGAVRYPLREMLAWEDRLLFIHCAMVLTGFLSIVEWDALFPDRRDYHILGPLSISTRLVFLAKVCSVLLLLVIFWAALNAGPALMFPSVSLTVTDSLLTQARHVGAHLTATLAASAFVFLLFAGFHGVLLNVLSPRWFRRASVYVQLVAVLALVLMFFAMPLVVAQAVPWIRADQAWIRSIPSFWLLGLYQVLAGRGSPVFSALAATAVKGLAIAVAVSALAYLASYRRHLKRSIESPGERGSEPGLMASAFEDALNLFLLRHPLERATFHFIRSTLQRSRPHRLVLAAYLGVAFAVALGLIAAFARDAAHGAPTPALVSVQLVLLLLVLSGMRFGFALPAELPANWVFQAADPVEKQRCMGGVRKAMLALGVTPVLAALLPLHTYFWGWQVAVAQLVYGAAVSAALIELLLLGFGKLPFTSSYLPGKANVKAFWPAYLMAFWVWAYGMAKAGSALLVEPATLAIFCTAVLGFAAALRWYGNRRLRSGFRFTFDDVPEPAVRTLDISYGSAAIVEPAPPAIPDTPVAEQLPPASGIGSPKEPRISAVLGGWIVRLPDELRSDLRFGFRSLMRNPGFTLAAVAILALAIGANTLLFTFFNSLVLKPLPMRDRHRNAQLTAMDASLRPHDYWSYPDFAQIRGQNPVFEAMYAWASLEAPVREPAARKVKVDLVVGDFFRLFTAPPIVGRTFGPEETEVLGRDAVVVLSHHAWQSLFSADPAVAGKTIRIRQTVFTVLGVTPAEFTGTDPLTIPDLWAPVTMCDQLMPPASRLADPENAFLKVAGILKPGLGVGQAEHALLGAMRGLNAQHPPTAAIQKISLQPMATYIPLTGNVLVAAACLFALFALLLLIACANLAGILLARGAARRREIAIRASIGASRARVVRQLLTESVLLCAIAAGPALLFMRAGLGPIQRYLWTLIVEKGFSVQPLAADGRVFAFMAAMVVAAGILLGLAPALEITRTGLAVGLKEADVVGNRGPRRLREWLVICQVTASLVLLVMAGIFVRNAQRVYRTEAGIDTDRVIDLRPDTSNRELVRRLRQDPRFEAVSETCRVPLSGGYSPMMGKVNGRVWYIFNNCVESEYFETVGLPVRRGRIFTPQEARAQARVAVISDATAQRLWPGEDPLGKIVPLSELSGGGAGDYEVVGVVPDTVNGLLNLDKDYTFAYLPTAPSASRNRGLIVRSRDVSRATMASLRRLCGEVEGVNTCDPVALSQVARSQRFPFLAASAVAVAVSVLALAMACAGLYGVVAFAVVQRTREVGIRMAVGAPPASVLRLFLTQMIGRVAIGIALGIPLCVALSKIAARLFVTSAVVRMFDLGAYVAAPLCLSAVTLLAVYIPARRAVRIDPMAALRQE